MNAVQTRQRPAGTGREVDTAMQIVRKGYHGTTPNFVTATSWDSQAIAGELSNAAECLAGMAEGFAAGVLDASELGTTDRLLVGAGRLIVELRQRQGATP